MIYTEWMSEDQEQKTRLPLRGEAFLVPLPDGCYGVCRVIRESSPEETREFGIGCVLVAATPWIGVNTPELAEPLLRQILFLKHHKWENTPAVQWVQYPLPPDFSRIGIIQPSRQEETLVCRSFGGWYIARQVYDQWRWDNDRGSVLQEEEAERLEKETRRPEGNETKQPRRSLTSIRSTQILPHWEGTVPGAVLDMTRKIINLTLDKLIEMPPDAPAQEKISLMYRCADGLNRLHEEYNWFDETSQREDLNELMVHMLEACDLDESFNLPEIG